MDEGHSGAHEWLIEFRVLPDSIERFSVLLDEELRAINSDYDAKRSGNFILKKPFIRVAEEGVFDLWLRTKGKLGGQNKIPRLVNDRSIMEQLLVLIGDK